MKVREGLYRKREINKVKFTSLRVGFRFYKNYLFQYKKKLGFDFDIRRKNLIRHSLSFATQVEF
jgi:hypothetical protein